MQTKNLRYDAVLFDLGYTLIYFEPPQGTIVQESLQAIGVERSVEQITASAERVWGDHYHDAETTIFPASEEYDRRTQSSLARALLASLGVEGSADVLQSYADAIESRFDRPGVIRPYPEVVEVLTSLQDHAYRLGIVSNWSWNLRDRVTQAGLDRFFELVWASAYAGCNKPHPRIFNQALARMEIPLERALYVGDSYQHDVVGARRAGLDVVLLDRDGSAEIQDCPVIHDLRGVLAMLGNSFT